jgi:hypothetical protein
MTNHMHRSALMMLLAASITTTTSTACVDFGEGGDLDEEVLDDEPVPAVVPAHDHIFFIEAKSFIRVITSDMVGSFGDAFEDFNLGLLAAATNAQFSEEPATGERTAAQFRVWAHVRLDVICTGTTPLLTLLEPSTDVGFEGPLQGELDPLQFRSTTSGAFAFQAAGRPNAIAEPAFLAVHPRVNRTIWYSVSGHVVCDDNAEASIVLDQVTNTNFPSLRIWSTHITRGQILPETLIVDRAQGQFTELWSLPTPPLL